MEIEVELYLDMNKLKQKKLKNNYKYLILTTEDTAFDLNYFQGDELEYYGAVFPKLIFKNQLFHKAILLFKLSKDIELDFVKSMKDYKSKKQNRHSLITIFDGFSNDNIKFMEKVYENIKINSTILGGGAGYFKKQEKAMFFHNGEFYKNCAILVFFNKKINLGISLGLNVSDGPFLATKTAGKLLKEIDYTNAYEFYATFIKKETGKDLNKENFYELAKDYPLGIVKHNKDTIVRDMISVNDEKELILAGEIEDNSVFNILKFKTKDIEKSTKKACDEANTQNSDFTFVFDCISRYDSLKKEYDNHINTIFENSNKNLFGALCIGEIANKENKYIDFLNKSCVIGGICR